MNLHHFFKCFQISRFNTFFVISRYFSHHKNTKFKHECTLSLRVRGNRALSKLLTLGQSPTQIITSFSTRAHSRSSSNIHRSDTHLFGRMKTGHLEPTWNIEMVILSYHWKQRNDQIDFDKYMKNHVLENNVLKSFITKSIGIWLKSLTFDYYFVEPRGREKPVTVFTVILFDCSFLLHIQKHTYRYILLSYYYIVEQS